MADVDCVILLLRLQPAFPTFATTIGRFWIGTPGPLKKAYIAPGARCLSERWMAVVTY